MKLFLSALCASFIIAPMSFADDCEKGKCDKEKKEGTILADCGKCEKDCDKECDKDCDKECDKNKKEEGTLAGKCKKDGDCDKEKEEGTLAGKCKKDGDCDKEKEEGTLADCSKCKKDDKEHEEEKKEGALA